LPVMGAVLHAALYRAASCALLCASNNARAFD